MTTTAKACTNHSPSWFISHWREWHRGHGCIQDDGKTRSTNAAAEIAQHEAYLRTGSKFLTDAELHFLRASTTSGDELLVRALDELITRRSTAKVDSKTPASFDHSTRTTKYFEPLLGFCACTQCQNLPM